MRSIGWAGQEFGMVCRGESGGKEARLYLEASDGQEEEEQRVHVTGKTLSPTSSTQGRLMRAI